jgi:hypothetical protein
VPLLDAAKFLEAPRRGGTQEDIFFWIPAEYSRRARRAVDDDDRRTGVDAPLI